MLLYQTQDECDYGLMVDGIVGRFLDVRDV